jgi:hypothetical protein
VRVELPQRRPPPRPLRALPQPGRRGGGHFHGGAFFENQAAVGRRERLGRGRRGRRRGWGR